MMNKQVVADWFISAFQTTAGGCRTSSRFLFETVLPLSIPYKKAVGHFYHFKVKQ
jgi:hypothetical protein